MYLVPRTHTNIHQINWLTGFKFLVHIVDNSVVFKIKKLNEIYTVTSI